MLIHYGTVVAEADHHLPLHLFLLFSNPCGLHLGGEGRRCEATLDRCNVCVYIVTSDELV